MKVTISLDTPAFGILRRHVMASANGEYYHVFGEGKDREVRQNFGKKTRRLRDRAAAAVLAAVDSALQD